MLRTRTASDPAGKAISGFNRPHGNVDIPLIDFEAKKTNFLFDLFRRSVDKLGFGSAVRTIVPAVPTGLKRILELEGRIFGPQTRPDYSGPFQQERESGTVLREACLVLGEVFHGTGPGFVHKGRAEGLEKRSVKRCVMSNHQTGIRGEGRHLVG